MWLWTSYWCWFVLSLLQSVQSICLLSCLNIRWTEVAACHWETPPGSFSLIAKRFYGKSNDYDFAAVFQRVEFDELVLLGENMVHVLNIKHLAQLCRPAQSIMMRVFKRTQMQDTRTWSEIYYCYYDYVYDCYYHCCCCY